MSKRATLEVTSTPDVLYLLGQPGTHAFLHFGRQRFRVPCATLRRYFLKACATDRTLPVPAAVLNDKDVVLFVEYLEPSGFDLRQEDLP